MVTVDWYTRAVLTVIAACLLWLCLSPSSLTTVVEAQNTHQRVVVVGWQDADNYIHAFPAHRVGGSATVPSGLPVRDVK